MRVKRMVASVCAVAGLAAVAAAAEPAPESLTSLDNAGPNLPPVGRSLFDFAVAKQVDGEWRFEVPFPFEALVEHLKTGLREGYRGPLKAVLHPIGRSLHRHAAAPHYFRYPRAVIAVDAESAPPAGDAGMMLKDRLYLGYQPASESIELIAYNEAAGRFEFQVVTDYREGGRPRVTYADRGLCVACHHNQSVIYPGGPWADSNNNARIGALLRAEADTFYGIPARISSDIPDLFDQATDRANLFSAYQLAWQQGCGATGNFESAVACRRDALVSALRYRLTSRYQLSDAGDGAYDRFAETLTEAWRARWPHGVSILSAHLLDRDPFEQIRHHDGELGFEEAVLKIAATEPERFMDYDEIYEPLYDRPPLGIWRVAAPIWGLPPKPPLWLRQVIGGLGDFLATSDIKRLTDHLAGHPTSAVERTVSCQVIPEDESVENIKIRFACVDGLGERAPLKGRLRGAVGGTLEGLLGRLRADNTAPAGLRVYNGRLGRSPLGWRAEFVLRDTITGLDARLGDGRLLRGLVLDWPAGDSGDRQPRDATMTLSVTDDFAPVVAAIDRLAAATLAGESDALGDAPFRRVAVLRPIFADLGMTPLDWCCMDADHLPPPQLHPDAE